MSPSRPNAARVAFWLWEISLRSSVAALGASRIVEQQSRPGGADHRRSDHQHHQDDAQQANATEHSEPAERTCGRGAVDEERVGEQGDGAHDRDDHQDVLAGQRRVDVGIARAGHWSARGRRERVAGEPVADGLHHEQCRQQQRKQLGDPAGDLLATPSQPPRAVPVAADHGDPQAVGHRLREQAHHHGVERVDLDEERDVLVEQRIGRVPRRGVAPHEIGLPAGGRPLPTRIPGTDDREEHDESTESRFVLAERPAESVVVRGEVKG